MTAVGGGMGGERWMEPAGVPGWRLREDQTPSRGAAWRGRQRPEKMPVAPPSF